MKIFRRRWRRCDGAREAVDARGGVDAVYACAIERVRESMTDETARIARET